MNPTIKPLAERQVWKSLAAHYQKVREMHLREIFADDPERGERMTAEAVGIYLDYSKNRITDETLKLLLQLAESPDCANGSTPCFGARRSTSQKTAPSCTWPCARREVHPSWSMARTWCLRSTPCSTRWRIFPTACAAAPGKVTPANAIRNVINIGIGGSDLGPVMAYEALKHYSERAMTFRFVSNVDGTDFAEAVQDLDAGGDALHRFVENFHDA